MINIPSVGFDLADRESWRSHGLRFSSIAAWVIDVARVRLASVMGRNVASMFLGVCRGLSADIVRGKFTCLGDGDVRLLLVDGFA
jgi:hypothetical protein